MFSLNGVYGLRCLESTFDQKILEPGKGQTRSREVAAISLVASI